MDKFTKHICILFFLFFILASYANSQDRVTTLRNDEKIMGLSLLWKEAAYNFAYFQRLPELDWNQEYASFIPKVLETENDCEYWEILQKFMTLLREGHTKVIPPENYFINYYQAAKLFPWFVVDFIEDKLYIITVIESLKEEIPLGSEVIEINDMIIDEYINTFAFQNSSFFKHTIRRNMIMYLRRFLPETLYPISITIKLDGKIKRVEIDSLLTSTPQYYDKFVHVSKRQDYPSFTILENEIGYINLAGKMDDKLIIFFDSIVPFLKNVKGILIDLRYNFGGTSVGDYMAMHFTKKDKFINNHFYTRINNANNRAFGAYADSTCIRFIGGPIRHTQHYEYFADNKFEKIINYSENTIKKDKRILDIPIIFLVNNNVGSATEDFLIVLNQLEVGTFVGEPTVGSCTQPLVVMLPGGGVGLIATQKTMFNESEEFTYISPHYHVRKTLEDILTNRDVIFDEGLKILKQQIEDKNNK